MADVLEVSEKFRGLMDGDILLALADVQAEWEKMTPYLELSWRNVGPRILLAVNAGKSRAVKRAAPHVSEAMVAQGASPDAVAAVNADGWANVTASGFPLPDLLAQAKVQAGVALNASGDWLQAKKVGADFLERSVSTEVADVSRSSVSVQAKVVPAAGVPVRMVNPGACSRCAVLAGQPYSDFKRHPRCRCGLVPVKAGARLPDSVNVSAEDYFHSLSESEQDRVFTKAGAQAIRDGADIGRVVNARRGMYRPSEGFVKTHSGVLGGRGRRGERLMPESIYKIARSRGEAVRLLREYGFVI